MQEASSRYRDITMLDCFQAMQYIEETYNATIEVNLSSAEHDGKHALLCITTIVESSLPNGKPIGIGMLAELDYKKLSRMPTLLHETLGAIAEECETIRKNETSSIR